MSQSKVKQKFAREDDYNPSNAFGSSIQKNFVHKQIVVKTGDSEDDFVIDEKPVLVEEVDLHKRINEEAKTTDLKYLLKQLMLAGVTEITGQEEILNSRKGFYGDITGVQDMLEGHPMVSADKVKETLGEEFKSLTVEQIAAMSDEDIAKYISQVRAQKAADEAKKKQEEVEQVQVNPEGK